MYNTSIWAKGCWCTGSLCHIRQNDTGMGKVESFILFLRTQRRCCANKREGPLKCNLGCVQFERRSIQISHSFSGRDDECKGVYVNMCLGVSVKYWFLMAIYFFGSFSAHWPLCNYLWDDWECYLSLWLSDLVYLPSRC